MKNKQIITALVVAALALTAESAFAQATGGGGAPGISEATSQVKGYFDALPKLIFMIAGVVGLIGALKVYGKWNSGDQDTQKSAVSWFGSMIFIVIVGTVVKAFFNI